MVSPSGMSAPTFYYDFNSPYAYLAASRVERVLPEVDWQPVGLVFLHRAADRVPWSLTSDEDRDAGKRICEARAEEYGLPPLRWPPGWPADSYTLLSLRAAHVAAQHGLIREYSRALFERNFVTGEGVNRIEPLVEAASEVGLDPEEVSDGIERPEIKERLKAVTAEAIAAGAIGVPTVVVNGEAFFGDDRLEDAAAAVRR